MYLNAVSIQRMLLTACTVALMAGCGSAAPKPGPDKQFASMLRGAATGAGSGAVTGFQVGSSTGAGAMVGAGIGVVAGGIRGYLIDQAEDDLLQLAAQTSIERRRAIVHQVLHDHYQRRLELHPTRDIYPADMFFYGDESNLRPFAKVLVAELARMNKQRLPWSRIAVTSYAMNHNKGNSDEESSYAQRLAERRARAICNHLVRAGIEPRRLVARGIITNEPILVDPYDKPERYGQAIEFSPLDR